MQKFELSKSVEAVKLNKRTGIPLTEPPVTIPYGAILDHVDEAGDYYKFTYLTDRYQMKRDTVRGALHKIKSHASQPAEEIHSAHQIAPEVPSLEESDTGPVLVFQPLAVEGAGNLSRARIPGGWLVCGADGSVTFVPDHGHHWDGGSR